MLWSKNIYFGRRILMSKMGEVKRRFSKYIRRTAKNKVVALLLIGCGLGTNIASDDATFLVAILICAVPLFFARRNYIY